LLTGHELIGKEREEVKRECGGFAQGTKRSAEEFFWETVSHGVLKIEV